MEQLFPDRAALELYLGLIIYSACLMGLGINLNSFAFQSMTREKARGNIESLLATPLRAKEIWLAKSLAVFLPGLVLGVALALVTLVAVNYIYFVPSIGFLVNPWIAVNSFVAAPLVYLLLSLCLLYTSSSLWRELAAWAEDDFRSINGQIEYLLTECVRQRKKGKR